MRWFAHYRHTERAWGFTDDGVVIGAEVGDASRRLSETIAGLRGVGVQKVAPIGSISVVCPVQLHCHLACHGTAELFKHA